MSTLVSEISGYRYSDSGTNCSHSVLLNPTFAALDSFFANRSAPRRVFDLGCGNGRVAALLADKGYEVAGIDPSKDGIMQAKAAFPGLRLETGSAYEDLP